jgi:carbon catabolite-derepressing protein kinase
MTSVGKSETGCVSQPLRIVSVLAEGLTNIVTLVQNQETGKYSVAKILNDDRRDLRAHLEAEAALQKDLDHPRILKVEDFQENLALADSEGNQLLATGILTEFAPKGDLFDLLTCFTQMPLLLARSYARQMVEATVYLHGKGIAHQDIKLENFLLDSAFNIKLADFGFSRKTTNEQTSLEQVGTPHYWAPEQHEQVAFNGLEIDIFNLGVAIFLLVAGRMPFEQASKDDGYYINFINGDEAKFWQMHEEDLSPSSGRSFFKDDFRKLLNGMLCHKASERMTIKEVVTQPWLNLTSEIMEKCGGIVAEFLKKKGVDN